MAERGYLEGTKHGDRLQHAALERPDLALRRSTTTSRARRRCPSTCSTGTPTRPACRRPTIRSICATATSRTSSSQGRDGASAATRIDLRTVKIPIYNLATREDHIAPAKSVFIGSSLFGGPVRFVLAGSGHIAGVVNPPEQEEVPVLDRRRAARRRLRGLARQGEGASGLMVARLARLGEGAEPGRGARPHAGRRRAEADRGRTGRLRESQRLRNARRRGRRCRAA